MPRFIEALRVIAELRYFGGFALAILAFSALLVLSALFGSAWGRHGVLAGLVFFFVLGGCAVIVYAATQASRTAQLSPGERPTARFAPIAISGSLCVWNVWSALNGFHDMHGARPVDNGAPTFTLLTGLVLGIAAVPGLWTSIRVRLNRFSFSENQPAPFTPEGTRRGFFRIGLLLTAIVAAALAKPFVGVHWAVLGAFLAMSVVLTLVERYANLRRRGAS